MQDKKEKILRLCADIECSSESGKLTEANSKILELLGVVVGKSKYSYDIDKAINIFIEKTDGCVFKKPQNGAMS